MWVSSQDIAVTPVFEQEAWTADRIDGTYLKKGDCLQDVLETVLILIILEEPEAFVPACIIALCSHVIGPLACTT